jgi:hypothetical protein
MSLFKSNSPIEPGAMLIRENGTVQIKKTRLRKWKKIDLPGLRGLADLKWQSCPSQRAPESCLDPQTLD